MKKRTALSTLLAVLLSFAVVSAPTFAQDLMNTPRPLFFNDLVALDTERHGKLRLPAERKNFAFAAQANLLPLTFAEVSQALRHYPLVFVAEGDKLALVAMSGLAVDTVSGNRFVDAKGEWRPGVYIPAYVRGYPFIAVRPGEAAEPILAFDPDAADFVRTGGQALINADGQPSDQLKGIMAFHAEYRQLAERTAVMTQALKDANVLEEGSLQLQSTNTQDAPKSIGGFLVVSEQKLKALPANALKKLIEADALGLAYAQLFSMSSLSNLMATAGGANTPSSAPTPESALPKAAVKRSRKQPE